LLALDRRASRGCYVLLILKGLMGLNGPEGDVPFAVEKREAAAA
jgi:hypothetical protein